MPHQCLSCSEIYDNDSNVILNGCSNCGGKLFLFIKKVPKEQVDIELSKDEKDLVLSELENIVDLESIDEPIILKLENIRILGSGKYEIDINQLLKKNKPVVFKVQDGIYVIDLNYLREKVKDEK